MATAGPERTTPWSLPETWCPQSPELTLVICSQPGAARARGGRWGGRAAPTAEKGAGAWLRRQVSGCTEGGASPTADLLGGLGQAASVSGAQLAQA